MEDHNDATTEQWRAWAERQLKNVEDVQKLVEHLRGRLRSQRSRAEEAEAALRGYIDSERQGHAEPCTYGLLCPYCEIARLSALVDATAEDLGKAVERANETESARAQAAYRLGDAKATERAAKAACVFCREGVLFATKSGLWHLPSAHHSYGSLKNDGRHRCRAAAIRAASPEDKKGDTGT